MAVYLNLDLLAWLVLVYVPARSITFVAYTVVATTAFVRIPSGAIAANAVGHCVRQMMRWLNAHYDSRARVHSRLGVHSWCVSHRLLVHWLLHRHSMGLAHHGLSVHWLTCHSRLSIHRLSVHWLTCHSRLSIHRLSVHWLACHSRLHTWLAIHRLPHARLHARLPVRRLTHRLAHWCTHHTRLHSWLHTRLHAGLHARLHARLHVRLLSRIT